MTKEGNSQNSLEIRPAFHSIPNLKFLNEKYRGPLAQDMGIEFIEATTNSLIAQMKVELRHTQPMGIMNGGVSLVIIETVGSVAAFCAIDQKSYFALGMEINANHLRKAMPGDLLTAVGSPLHLGKQVQVWGVEIKNSKNQPVCVGRLTAMIQKKE